MDSAKEDVPGETTVTMRADRGKHSGGPPSVPVTQWQCLGRVLEGGLPEITG